MAVPESVEVYLAACPADSRAALEHLRAMIKAAAPEATETISYPDASLPGPWPDRRLDGRLP